MTSSSWCIHVLVVKPLMYSISVVKPLVYSCSCHQALDKSSREESISTWLQSLSAIGIAFARKFKCKVVYIYIAGLSDISMEYGMYDGIIRLIWIIDYLKNVDLYEIYDIFRLI
ncbi:hypothetical protein CEXT_255081 [Caerostris extrusa]|uniref:Uncharacterized protein n=1 Tax=Caerostris extrusa TaxID=172846 RepID=A0AAV4Y1F8_CAEEX|nr:hypothetical protein CEXT_255081 [Caerostris extrusa]